MQGIRNSQVLIAAGCFVAAILLAELTARGITRLFQRKRPSSFRNTFFLSLTIFATLVALAILPLWTKWVEQFSKVLWMQSPSQATQQTYLTSIQPALDSLQWIAILSVWSLVYLVFGMTRIVGRMRRYFVRSGSNLRLYVIGTGIIVLLYVIG